MMVDLVQSSSVLKMVSTVTAGIFAGGALYITLVESPARMTHDATSAITMWKPSFVRAKSVQSKFAIVSSLSSFGVYACLQGTRNTDAIHWVAAGCGMLSLFPFTLIFIKPVNDQLIETEKCISVKGEEWITDNLNHWTRLHSVRTLISTASFCFMVYTLYKS